MLHELSIVLAEAVLAMHLVVIAFNVFGLFAIALGGWLGWSCSSTPVSPQRSPCPPEMTHNTASSAGRAGDDRDPGG